MTKPSPAILGFACLVAFSLLNQASAQQPGDVQSNSVIVCEHSEFLGHCETFTLEPGKRHVLVPNPFALKGKISSIAVGYDLETWVFTGVYFSGTSAVIDRTKKTLEVHLTGGWGYDFTVFHNYPFPWSIRLDHVPNTPPFKGAVTSSVDLLTGPTFQSWNDRIQSFIVYPRGSEPPGVHTLSAGIGKLGAIGATPPPIARFFPMPEDLSHLRAHYDDLFDFDNQALLIRVPPSVEAVLFDEPSMTGNSLKIPGAVAGTNGSPDAAFQEVGWKGELVLGSGQYGYPHWYALNRYQFDGKVSSLIVRVPGWNMGMEAPERGGEGDLPRHRAPPAQQSGMTQVGEVLPLTDAGLPTVQAHRLEVETDINALTLEPNTNRPGHDYKDFPINEPRADHCRAACATDSKCQAFTYVNPGADGTPAHCWLKNAAAPAETASCCVSGVKKTVD